MNERIKAGSDIHAGDGGYGIGTKENYDAFVKVRNKSLAAARIRRLAEQAEQYAIDRANEGTDEDFDYSFDDNFQAKFAELIVRECIGIAKNWEDELESADLIEESNAAGIVAYRIARQFGVEL